jgi:hypothetical protein
MRQVCMVRIPSVGASFRHPADVYMETLGNKLNMCVSGIDV